MHQLTVRHGTGQAPHHPDDQLVVDCRPGEVLGLVDVSPDGDGVDFTVSGPHVQVLDQRHPARASAPHRSSTCTTVRVTRDVRELHQVADRVVVVYAGHIVEAGASDRVVHNPRHPLTRRLLSGARAPAPLAGPHRGCPFVAECPLGDDVCSDHVPELREVAERRVACHYAELGPVKPPPP